MSFNFGLALFLIWITVTLAADAAAEKDADDCPPVKTYTAEYHLESACNKKEQNRFQDSLNRGMQRRRIQESGIYHVPDRYTIHHCNDSDGIEDVFHHLNSSDPVYHDGYNTMWIVHNKASYPVVLSWVDRNRKVIDKDDPNKYHYHEVSAHDGKTSPPHHDPNAILQPNQWTSLSTYDGHVFFARRVYEAKDATSQTKTKKLGPVVMQHRVGLIPIQNVFGHALDLFCDPNDPDEEPVIQVDETHVERAPEFRRSLRPPLRPCNTQDIGFRNLVGCPLNVYYSGMYNMTGLPHATPDANCSFTPKSCHEQFKFHLGKNPYSADFMWAWDSQTKFEGTYVGHNFVFRLTAHDDIVVDSVTIEPTYIQDCSDADTKEWWTVVQENDGFRASVIAQEKEQQKQKPQSRAASPAAGPEGSTLHSPTLRGAAVETEHQSTYDDGEM